MPNGLLVVIEGIDGSGKTTLQRGLAAALRAADREVVETKEPTNGPLGQRIRALAASGREQITGEEEFGLFHEDRRINVAEVVRPALANGAIVVQDRSYFSSVAYQGARGLDRAQLLVRSQEIAPTPDLLLVVDLPAEVALERIRAGRGAVVDDFETLSSLSEVREVFLGFDGAIVIDGLETQENMLAQALALVRAKLPG